MKFTTFLKIFAICFCSLIGAFAIGYGVMYITGAFTEPEVQPTEIVFEFDEYNVDGDFTVKVTSPTEDVNMLDLELSLYTNKQVTEKDGKLSDGVITIPKTAKIGESILVQVDKTINDNECGGLAWISGGHSEIRAKSTNPECETAKAKVNVDVPVYAIEIETRVSSLDNNSDTFVINSTFNANLKFIPQRSAYQFSNDGNNGTQLKYKNAYFMLQSNNDAYISQIERTNQFVATKVGNGSSIIGYCFCSTVEESNFLKLHQDKTEEARYSEIMAKLEQGSNAELAEEKISVKNSKSVSVIDINVDKLVSSGEINDVYVDTVHTIYANKTLSQDNKNASNLGIRLLSNFDETVSLQSKLNNVGIRFLLKQGNTLIDAVNNTNSIYNIVKLEESFYSQTVTVIENKGEANEETKIYYLPVITSSVDNYHWQFAVNEKSDESLYVEICYFENNADIPVVQKSFETKNVVSNAVSWNLTEAEKNIELKIFDNLDYTKIEYDEYDLKTVTQVPENNLYKTRKYFAYLTEKTYKGQTLDNFIYCSSGVSYTIGAQTFTLYEIEDGIIKAKSLDAHGLTFNVLFLTVKTDYKGEVKLTNENLYVYDQYSRDTSLVDETVSNLTFTVTKTLQNLISHLEFNSDNAEDLIYKDGVIAFVQNSVNPFDIVISYGNAKNETEEAIFKKAIENEDIVIIAKANNVETDLVRVSNSSSFTQNDISNCRYTMTIGSLPVGNSEIKIELYIRYYKTPTVYEDLKVNNEITNVGEEHPISEYIEIYSGEAKVFKFNVNYQCELEAQTEIERIQNDDSLTQAEKEALIAQIVTKTSETNRIVVSSFITKQEGTSIINTITTSYMLGEKEVTALLFVVENDEITSIINVILQDKYGRQPLYSSYKFESSDTSVMITSGQSITFAKTGNAELRLISESDNQIQDILYLSSQSSGQVTKVESLSESINSYKSIKTSEVIYDIQNNSSAYQFMPITVSVFGYKGSKIYLNSTETYIENEVQKFVQNIVAYTYTYGTEEGSLIAKTKFEFVNSEDLNELKGLIQSDFSFDKYDYIEFEKDFGQRKTVQLLASVPELGISQLITLDIKPNVSISITQPTSTAQSVSGVPYYTGVYAESSYTIGVNMQYIVVDEASLDKSSYALFVYDNNTEIKLTKESTVAKITSNNITFSRNDATATCAFEITIEFDSQNTSNGFKQLALTFQKEKDEEITNYDASYTIYLNVNPNVKTKLANDDVLYLTTLNQGETVKTYGSYEIFGNKQDVSYPVVLERISGTKTIDPTRVSFNILTNDYRIEEDELNSGNFTLYCDKLLSDKDNIDVEVLYDGYVIGKLTLIVSPNIQMNKEHKGWVLYGEDGGEYYLKLVNGKTGGYSIDEIKDNFTNVSEIKSIDILPKQTKLLKFENDVYTVDENVTDRLVMFSENGNTEQDRFKIVVTLSNGCSLTFNVMLMPVDLPFVNYPNVDGDIQDLNLSDLLLITADVEWLKSNGYYHTITTTVNEVDEHGNPFKGNPIAYPLNDLSEKEGIQLIDYATYRTNNGEYANYFKLEADSFGSITTNPVGADTYVIIYANLNPWATNPLIIPYLVKIQKELSLGVYYPYAEGDSQTDLDASVLSSVNSDYVREYLSFDNNNEVTIDLLSSQTNVPYSSPLTQKRIAILKNSEEYVSTIYQTQINFEVVDLYYNILDTFVKANDISRYASFSSEQNSGKLRISANGSTKVRLKVKITTQNGLEGYYYISVGEIPTMQLQANGKDVSDLNVTANTVVQLKDYNYSLKNITSGIITDVTELLRYYSPSVNLTIDKNADGYYIETQSTTNNWLTTLIFYTKYGYLADVKVNVKSNYEVKANPSYFITDANQTEYKIESGAIIDESYFNATVLNEDTVESITDIEIKTITQIKDELDLFEYDNYINIHDNKIVIGAVTSEVTVTYLMVFKLTPQNQETVEYTYEFTFTVLPVFKVEEIGGEVISINNKLEISDIEAEIDLNSLFNYFGENKSTLKDWYNFVDLKEMGTFRTTILSEVPLKNDYIAEIHNSNATISLGVPEVVTRTIISFKVEYINTFGESESVVLTSYFTFTINPTFEVSINYPKADDSKESSFDLEYFYVGTKDSPEKFNLDTNNALSSNKRFVVTDESKLSNMFVSYEKSNGSVYPNEENIKYYAYNTDFTFVIEDSAEATIIFIVYYKITSKVDHSDNFFPVASYTVKAFNNIANVWTTKTLNFNTNETQNSENNIETIYVGTQDDIIRSIKVKVRMNVTDDYVAPEDNQKLYIKITSLFGTPVETEKQLFEAFRECTYQVFLSDIDISRNIEDDFYQLEYSIVDENGDSIQNESELKATINVEVLDITTRISLNYYNETVDIYKLFNLINTQGFSGTQEESAYPILVLDKQIGVYFAQRVVDIKFDTNEIALSTGQSVNLLSNNNSVIDTSKYFNHSYLLNMSHESTGVFYTAQEIIKNSVEYTITNVENNDASYLRITPLIQTIDSVGYVCDYLFFAMGAPNESVTVKVTLSIKISGTELEQTFIFTISNDYKNLSLKNSDNTDNSQTNRNRIYALSDVMSNNSYTFATAGGKTLGDDFVFIEHTNKIEGAVEGNIASFFNVTLDNGGSSHIAKVANVTDLIFLFNKIEFGNENIDLIFTDEYGYTFNYYITLLANYNPVYTGATITVFEQDTMFITDKTDNTDSSMTYIKIRLDKVEEIISDLSLINNINIQVSYQFTLSNSDTITINEEDNNSPLVRNINIIGFDLLPDSYFEGNTQISGTLLIKLSYSSRMITLNVPLVVKQRYTIKTVDDVIYVRDDIPFNLLDIIDVVDNKTSVKVGERSLTKDDSLKLNYQITKNGGSDIYNIDNMPLDESTDFSISLGIRAINKNTTKSVTMPINAVDKNLSFTSLQDLFGIESINNYEFRLVYWDALGNINEIQSNNNTFILSSLYEEFKNISITFYAQKFEGKVMTYSTSLLTEFNGTTGLTQDKNDFITLTITEAIIIKDQILKIGTRKITNSDDSSYISVSFNNGKFLGINCDKNETMVISLCEKGIITSGNYTDFYTGKVTVYNEVTDAFEQHTVINGMLIEHIAKLKDIKFEEIYIDNNKITTSDDGYTIKVSLNELDTNQNGEYAYDLIENNKIYYGTQEIKLNVKYGYNPATKEYKKVSTEPLTENLKVTLKYVAVNKLQAYGANVVKTITKFKLEDNGQRTIQLEDWAGGNKPFVLITGYSTATSFPTTEDLSLILSTKTSADIVYSINTTDSSGIANYASINDDGVITLEEGFDLTNNYLAIDVKVKYKEGQAPVTIDTVRIAILEPQINNIRVNASRLAIEDGKVNVSDIFKLITVTDKIGNSYEGESIRQLFKNEFEYFNFVFVDNSSTPVSLLDESLTTIEVGDDFEGEDFVISYKLQEDVSKNILNGFQILKTKFDYYCIVSNNFNNFKFVNKSEDEMISGILEKIRFIDIYGEENDLSGLFVNENDKTSNDKFVYYVVETQNGMETSYDFTFKYYVSNDIITLGTIKAYNYNTNNINNIELTGGTFVNVNDQSIWEDYQGLVYGYTEYTELIEEVPKTVYKITIPKSDINISATSARINYSYVAFDYSSDKNNYIITLDFIDNLNYIAIIELKDASDNFVTVGFIKEITTETIQVGNIIELVAKLNNRDASNLKVRIANDSSGAVSSFYCEDGIWKISTNNVQGDFDIVIYEQIMDIDGNLHNFDYYSWNVAS